MSGERAIYRESIITTERATQAESASIPERATLHECAKIRERAIGYESTIDHERAICSERYAERMRRKRKHVPLRERLASALSILLSQEVRDDLRERKVSADVVISMFDLDHNVLHALDGADLWWNLTPMLRAPHREKARKDTSIVAKVRRIEIDSDRWRDLLKPKRRRDPKRRKYKWSSRPFPKRAKNQK